jgi:hypothetical protein
MRERLIVWCWDVTPQYTLEIGDKGRLMLLLALGTQPRKLLGNAIQEHKVEGSEGRPVLLVGGGWEIIAIPGWDSEVCWIIR